MEFSTLAFHLRSVGDLSNEERDVIVDFLHERMETQERTELEQLQNFCQVLRSVAHRNVWMCSERADDVRSQKLHEKIVEYFEAQPEIAHDDITTLSFSRETSSQNTPVIASQVNKSKKCRGVVFLFGKRREDL